MRHSHSNKSFNETGIVENYSFFWTGCWPVQPSKIISCLHFHCPNISQITYTSLLKVCVKEENVDKAIGSPSCCAFEQIRTCGMTSTFRNPQMVKLENYLAEQCQRKTNQTQNKTTTTKTRYEATKEACVQKGTFTACISPCHTY